MAKQKKKTKTKKPTAAKKKAPKKPTAAKSTKPKTAAPSDPIRADLARLRQRLV